MVPPTSSASNDELFPCFERLVRRASRSFGGFRRLISRNGIGVGSNANEAEESTPQSIISTEPPKPGDRKLNHKILHKNPHHRGPCFDEKSNKHESGSSNAKAKMKLPTYKNSTNDKKLNRNIS